MEGITNYVGKTPMKLSTCLGKKGLHEITDLSETEKSNKTNQYYLPFQSKKNRTIDSSCAHE